MKCQKCGADVEERFFVPLSAKSKLKDGLWVCLNCLPPKEQLRIKLKNMPAEKEEAFELSDSEYESLVQKASWECPYRRRPEDCAGELCDIDEWDACVEALRARRTLDKYFKQIQERRRFGYKVIQVG